MGNPNDPNGPNSGAVDSQANTDLDRTDSVPTLPAATAPGETRLDEIEVTGSEAATTREEVAGQTGLRSHDEAEAPAHEPPLAKMLRELPRARNVDRPRQGPCVYMMFNLETPAEEVQTRQVQAEVSLLASLPDFHISMHDGWLIITGTAERATYSVLTTAESFRKVFPDAGVFAGYGSVEHKGSSSFKINGRHKHEETEQWKTCDPGIYLTAELLNKLEDPDSRESTHCGVETAPFISGHLVTLEKFIAKVSDKIGGPDELVGKEAAQNVEDLIAFFGDDEAKLIFVNGEAGKGKSRVLLEALAKYPVDHIKCSLDAGDRNNPGSSLVTLASQLAAALDESYNDEPDTEGRSRIQIFNDQPKASKVEFAQTEAAQLTEMYINALRQLTFFKGQKMLFVLEDMHNADNHSEIWLEKIVSEYINPSTEGISSGKVLMSKRPEERYESEAQKNLIKGLTRYYGDARIDDIVKSVDIEGLDFSNDDNAYKFIYHMFPKPVRAGKRLGRWFKTAAKAAGDSPFIMTHIIKGLLQDPENFVADGDVIKITEEAEAKISQIDPTDPGALTIFFQQKIANLSDDARRVLQCLSLAGGKLTTVQIGEVITSLVGARPPDMVKVRDELVRGAYTKESDEGTWELQHEMLKPFVEASIEPVERKEVSEFLYNMISGAVDSNPDTRLALLHNRAAAAIVPDRLWADYYRDDLKAAVEQAHNQHARSKAFAIAKTILDKDHGIRTIKKAVEKLADIEHMGVVSEAVAEITVIALTELAENGVWLGRFDEAEEAIKALEAIELLNPDLIPRERVMAAKFEAAYLQRRPAEMREIYENKIKGKAEIPKTRQIISLIKLLFKEGKHTEVAAVYAKNKELLERLDAQHRAYNDEKPHPDVIETIRVATLRVPLARIKAERQERTARDGTAVTVDEDICEQLAALKPGQAEELEALFLKLEDLNLIRKGHPTTFNPSASLSLVEQEADMLMMLSGNQNEKNILRRKAAKLRMAECWRQSDQMGIHDQAARAALLLGNLYATEAVTRDSDGVRYNRTLLLKAMEVYNTECRISTDELDPGNFYCALRQIQINRVAGLLALSYENELQTVTQVADKNERTTRIEAIRVQMAGPVQNAFEQFIELNRVSLEQKTAQEDYVYHEDPDMCYYIEGFFYHVYRIARQLKLEIPSDFANREKMPFLSISSTLGAINHGTGVTDLGLANERTHKMRGASDLHELLMRERDYQLAHAGR